MFTCHIMRVRMPAYRKKEGVQVIHGTQQQCSYLGYQGLRKLNILLYSVDTTVTRIISLLELGKALEKGLIDFKDEKKSNQGFSLSVQITDNVSMEFITVLSGPLKCTIDVGCV